MASHIEIRYIQSIHMKLYKYHIGIKAFPLYIHYDVFEMQVS